jgi:hypothetical protein
MKEKIRSKPLNLNCIKGIKEFEKLTIQEYMPTNPLMDILAKIAYESKILGHINFNQLKNWNPYVKS